MATKKISELNALTTPESDDLIAIVDASATETKKITYGNISKHIVNVGTEVEEDSRINFIKSKNLFDKNNLEIAVYDYSTTGVVPPKVSSTTRCAVGPDRPIKVKPNTKYTFSSNDDIKVSIGELKSDRTLIQSISWTQSTLTFTTTANTEYIIFNINYSNSTTITSAIFITIQNAIMVNEGETATSYEPYKTNSINVDGETFSETIKIGNEVDGKSRVNFIHSRNLFTIASVLPNTALNNNVVFSSNEWDIFVIPVEIGTTYTISKTSYNGGILSFNTTFPKIGDTVNNAQAIRNISTLTFEAKDNYLCLMIAKSDDKSTIQVEIGSTATTYEPYTQSQIVVDNEKYSDTLNVGVEPNNSGLWVEYEKNLVNIKDMTSGYRMNGDGTLLTDSSYSVSNYIEVEPNTMYTFNQDRITYFNRVCFFDNSKSYIGQDGTNDKKFKTPENTKYLRYGWETYTLNNSKLTLQKGTEPITTKIKINGKNEIFKNEYSTSEVVIGEWLGKPLYRKVYSISNPSSSNTDYGDLTSLNIDRLVHLYGYYKRDTGTFGIPFHDSDENYSVMFLSSANRLRGRIANASGVADTKVIIEYTKTTDA